MITSDHIVIRGNDWSSLVPSSAGSWTPTRRVSICIPTRNPGPGLVRTVRCLGAQTYPAELIEIVVADDGSDAPVVLPDDFAHPVRVIRQERTLDFGGGQARNLAASAASGEILLFLDADVIPERQVVECYARWFERCDLAVPMGLCRFVEVDDLETPELVELVNSASMQQRFEGRDVDDQSWRERHFARLDDLRTESIDAFRVTIGATLAVSADQFQAVGGFPELGVRGVEDTAFGYRVHNNGGVLILDRDAVHWHQGRRNLSTDRRQRIDQARTPYVQAVIPVPGFRHGGPPSDPPVEPSPILRVHVDGDGAAAEMTRRSVGADPSGNVLLSEGPGGQRDAASRYDDAFAQVDLPAGTVWSPSATEHILDFFDSKRVGVLYALLDDGSGATREVTAVRTRALRRAAQVRPGDDPIAVASDLFGAWWLDAATLGVVGGFSSDAAEVLGAPGTTAGAGADDPSTSAADEPLGSSVLAGLRRRVAHLSKRRPRPGLWLYRRMMSVLRRAAR